MIDKNNRKDYLAGILYLCIFLFMLVLNKLSVYIADDFRYLYSFNDFKRIESVPQVILSMRAHRYNMFGCPRAGSNVWHGSYVVIRFGQRIDVYPADWPDL